MQGSLVHYACYQMRYYPSEPFRTTVLTLTCLSNATSGLLFDNTTLHIGFLEYFWTMLSSEVDCMAW